MRKFITLALVSVLAALAGPAFAAADRPVVQFTQKPTATKVAEGVKIDFAVSAATDVEVYIEDGNGKVVCHLVAGMLGKTPPPPLKADSLEQSVIWDGNNDSGKPALGLPSTRPGDEQVGAGPFKVRVALGIKPQFDGFLMYNPAASGAVEAMAVGPGGTIYVFHTDNVANENMGGAKIKLYNRDGTYQKALTPFPADIAPAKVKALGVFQTAEGDLVPRIHNWEQLAVYPDATGVRGRDISEFSSQAVDSKGRVYWLVCGPSLCAVDADGGIPYDTFLGPVMLADIKELRARDTVGNLTESAGLALSTDEKYVYFAGFCTAGKGIGDYAYKSATPLPCVYRVDVEKRGPAEVFVGKLGQPGKEKELLTAPRGLAVAKGLLYVTDRSADRVVAFKESDRSYAGEIAIKSPYDVAVDPATGAVYVCAMNGEKPCELIKFTGLDGAKELYRINLPKAATLAGVCGPRIAMDASAKGGPVRLWVPGSYYGLYCIEDAGGKFVDKGDPRDTKGLCAEAPRDLTVDHLRNELYFKANGAYYRFDALTGKLKATLPMTAPQPSMGYGMQVVAGADGDLYTATSLDFGMYRFDHAGKLINWEGLGKPLLAIPGFMSFQSRSLALKPFAQPDEFYLVPPNNYLDATGKTKFTSLNAIGQDGKTRRTLIWQCTHGAVPRLDAKGNIYLADMVKPPGKSYPEFFDGKLDAPPNPGFSGAPFWNSFIYGSIIKFPPSGGIIWSAKELSKSVVGKPPAELLAKPKQPFMAMFGCNPFWKGEIQGALWTRFGFAPYGCGTAASGSTVHCGCEAGGFDVDPFGRVFYPNQGQFRVEVVDTNNNWIGTFGQYGNEDSGGKDAKVAKPEIPLAWPSYVAVSDTHAYVNDIVSRRVVRIKLAHAAEETCQVK